MKISCLKFFQGLDVCNMNAKHVQTDQGYQSHQLLSDLDTYMSRLGFRITPGLPRGNYPGLLLPQITFFKLSYD